MLRRSEKFGSSCEYRARSSRDLHILVCEIAFTSYIFLRVRRGLTSVTLKVHFPMQKMVEKIPLRKAIIRLDYPAIIAFGNPLLDIFVVLENDDLLKKYNLRMDDETELCETKIQELIADLPSELMSIFVGVYLVFALYISVNFSGSNSKKRKKSKAML